MKSPIRDAQNKQRGRMRPAGRQFDMPVLQVYYIPLKLIRSLLDL